MSIYHADNTHSAWRAPDGTLFPFREWLPTSAKFRKNPRAVCVAIHGLSGSAEDFLPLAEILTPRGMVLLAPNLRGQGKDPLLKRRGNLGNFDLILDDIEAILHQTKERFPGVPLIVYGESMGAMLLVHREARPGSLPVEGVILASPVIDLKGELSPIQRSLFVGLGNLLPWLRLDFAKIGKQFSEDRDGQASRMTRNADYENKLRDAPHRVNRMTLRFLRTLSLWVLESKKKAPCMQSPVLVLAAGQDVFIRPDQVDAFFIKVGSADKELVHFPESYHLLLHDFDRPEVERTLIKWLEKRFP